MENNGIDNKAVVNQNINLPEKSNLSSEIFHQIKEQEGKARVRGFGVGSVIYPEDGGKINIGTVKTEWKDLADIYVKKGFTEEEVRDGIIVINEYKSENPNLDQFTDGKNWVKRLYLSRRGKVIEEQDSKKCFESKLTPRHIDALKRIALLSTIPRQIKAKFESYQKFEDTLGEKERSETRRNIFIGSNQDYLSFRGRDTYEGGLREFVNALELKEKGKLDQIDTTYHTLRSSLAEKDPITEVLETLEKARSYNTNASQPSETPKIIDK